MEPDTNSNQSKIPAREILDKIERGEPVEYDGVIIEGDLDLSKLDLPKEHVERTLFEKMLGLSDELNVISSPITITNSVIRGSVDLSNAHFKETINFIETKFVKNANFSLAVFSGGDTLFDGAVFSGSDTFFDRAVFSGGDTFFNRAVFSGGNAYFREASFSGGLVDFAGAVFSGGDTFFDRAIFSGGNAFFKEASFSGGLVDFSGAKFSGDAYFGEAEFTGGDAYFEGTEFNAGGLYLSGAQFRQAIRIRWRDIIDKDNLDYEFYSALKENYKTVGWFVDADKCYYQTRKELRQDLPCYYKPIDWILMILYGYGVKPERTLFWSIVLISLFGVFFWSNIGGIVPSYEAENAENESLGAMSVDSANECASISLIESLGFSSAIFLSGTKLFVDPPDYTNKTGVPRQSPEFTWTKRIFILERVMGALLFLMFLGAVGRSIITR